MKNITGYRTFVVCLVLLIVMSNCNRPASVITTVTEHDTASWQQSLSNAMPLMGHRNWLLVTDMAFPKQNAAGIHYINTGEKLLPVLKQVLKQLQGTRHIRPVLYQDRELGYLTEQLAPGVTHFRDSVNAVLHDYSVQTILHDSVFTKIDAASRLFDVWVLKTTELIPYTSVFMQLNCGYWSDENEKNLREAMRR